jgi:hypothetical protein
VTFVVIKRTSGGAPYKHVLGRYPGLFFKATRSLAPGILKQLADGKTPREEKKAREEQKKAREREEEHRGRGLRARPASAAAEYGAEFPLTWSRSSARR